MLPGFRVRSGRAGVVGRQLHRSSAGGGEQRREGRLSVLAITLMALAGTFGCSPEHGRPQQPHGSGIPVPTATAPAQPTAAAGPTQADFCTVRTPPAWQRSISSGRIPRLHDQYMSTVAVSPDGRTRFAVLADASRQRLVEFTGRSGRSAGFHEIAAYPAGQVSGDGFGQAQFDGRWLIYEVQLSPDNNADWKIYAWDSQGGGAPQVVADSPGKDVPAGPYVVPQLSHGKATWVLPLADGRRQVHLYDLARRTDRVVTTAHVYRSTFVGDLLVWQEADAPGAETVLKAVSAVTGAPATLPPVVAAIRQTGEIVGDGTAWVWLAPDYSGAYEWKPGWSHSATIVSGDSTVQYLGLAGNILTFTDENATFAADLETHSMTRITPQNGTSQANSPWIEVGYLPTENKHSDLAEYLLDTGALPHLPTCSAWVPTPEPRFTPDSTSVGAPN